MYVAAIMQFDESKVEGCRVLGTMPNGKNKFPPEKCSVGGKKILPCLDNLISKLGQNVL